MAKIIFSELESTAFAAASDRVGPQVFGRAALLDLGRLPEHRNGRSSVRVKGGDLLLSQLQYLEHQVLILVFDLSSVEQVLFEGLGPQVS